MSKKIAVMLGDGFEPVEVTAPVDIWRRGGQEVVLISVMPSNNLIAAQDIHITADTSVGQVDLQEFDAIFIPGGSLGVENLSKCIAVASALKRFMVDDKLVFSICAGPTILAELGLLEGRMATCYPGCEDTFPKGAFSGELGVCRDGNLVTASGPGFALSFGIECLRAIAGDSIANAVADDMLIGK